MVTIGKERRYFLLFCSSCCYPIHEAITLTSSWPVNLIGMLQCTISFLPVCCRVNLNTSSCLYKCLIQFFCCTGCQLHVCTFLLFCTYWSHSVLQPNLHHNFYDEQLETTWERKHSDNVRISFLSHLYGRASNATVGVIQSSAQRKS